MDYSVDSFQKLLSTEIQLSATSWHDHVFYGLKMLPGTKWITLISFSFIFSHNSKKHESSVPLARFHGDCFTVLLLLCYTSDANHCLVCNHEINWGTAHKYTVQVCKGRIWNVSIESIFTVMEAILAIQKESSSF